MVGRSGTEFVADYRHPPAAVVPLAFPFVIFGREVAEVRLSPPAYGELVRLREADRLGAHDLLTALTGEPEAVIAAMRWPDVEVVLETGLALLPPDLAGRLAARGEDDGDEPPRADAPAGEPDDGDVADELGMGLEPAEFMREV